MEIKIKKLHPDAKMPFRANPTDAGADLYAVSKEAKGAINELYKEKRIEVIETINQKAFKIK